MYIVTSPTRPLSPVAWVWLWYRRGPASHYCLHDTASDIPSSSRLSSSSSSSLSSSSLFLPLIPSVPAQSPILSPSNHRWTINSTSSFLTKFGMNSCHVLSCNLFYCLTKFSGACDVQLSYNNSMRNYEIGAYCSSRLNHQIIWYYPLGK